jgi:transcriptional regulator with GAF, ATPase, and Fis domain
MAMVRETIDRIGKSGCTRVLILGETGTGKETAARILHGTTSKSRGPFLAFNCSGIRPDLLESRFLGHEKGSFTGATESRVGLFAAANGGTLFLDEIGDLTLEAQGLLLRVLEDGTFMPIGSTREMAVNVNVIAATNRDIHKMVRNFARRHDDMARLMPSSAMFRDDLYQRLSTILLKLPPLREHKEDIPELVAHFRKIHGWAKNLKASQLDDLMDYDYPGNVRELFHLLERAEILGLNDFRRLVDEQRLALSPTPLDDDCPDDINKMLARHVRRVYEKYGNNLALASRKLVMAKNTVRKYLENEP